MSAVLYIWPCVSDLRRKMWELLTPLKLDLYGRRPSPVSNQVFTEEASVFLRLWRLILHRFRALMFGRFKKVAMGICPHLRDLSFSSPSFPASTIAGCAPCSGSPPTGRAGGLPSDLGAEPSGLSQCLWAAKTQQMHHTQAGITISGTVWTSEMLLALRLVNAHASGC